MQWLVDRLELSRGGAENMLPMEGLRGVAVFLVFLVHFATLAEPWFASVQWIASLIYGLHAVGNTGVDLFFVLSGYLIYATLMRRPQPFLAVMTRRLRRIYPAFLVVFAVYLVLGFALPSLNKLPTTDLATWLIANLLLLPGLFPITPLITVAWSLSYELFFYLLIPIVIAGMQLRTWSAQHRIAGLVTVSGLLFAYWATTGGHPRLAMFLAGMLLYELLGATRWRPPASLALLAAGVAVLLKVVPTADSLGFTMKTLALFIGFGLLSWACIAQPKSWLGCGLSWAPLRWLGNISYSYYLAHSLGLHAGFMIAKAVLPAGRWGLVGGVLLLPATFALTLVPSLLLYLAIERPLSLVPRDGRRRVLEATG
jgi:exopolysaccharide production protein ExoZ